MHENIYKPYLMQIANIVEETSDVMTFRLKFKNQEEADQFSFKAGQFAEYSVMGEGESTFCIASSPTRKDYIECTFRKAGRVTTALSKLEVGDTIGVRGPYGNTFPIEQWEGKNLLYIAGGIALPPMRCVIWNTIDLREKYKDITILYGARTVHDLVYKDELKEWDDRPDINLVTTVDPGGQTPEWTGEVGFVPTILEKMAPKSENTIAVLCGPPIMIKYTMPILKKYGFKDDDIFTTLENRMKCGFGKCGRCNVGPVFVCKDGPVFTYEQMMALPQEY
ncbi:MAG: FAD/NAD(P)-binding protein [Bacteroidales bacterium]